MKQDKFTKRSVIQFRKLVSRMLQDFHDAFGDLPSITKDSTSEAAILVKRYAARYPEHGGGDEVSIASGDFVQQLVWQRADSASAECGACRRGHMACLDSLSCAGAASYCLVPASAAAVGGCCVVNHPRGTAGLFLFVSSLHAHRDNTERAEAGFDDYYRYGQW